MDVVQFLSALLVLVITGRLSLGQHTCDQCDCKLNSEDEHAVFNVKTHCNTGSIYWNSAYGAILLEVQPVLRNSYKTCFVLESQNIVTQVSQEVPPSLREGNNYNTLRYDSSALTLRPLVTVEGKSRELCVSGRTKEPVMLYFEVERTNNFTGIPVVSLLYDVQEVTDEILLDPLEECRPCSQDEMLEAYCTSDFVVVGSMHDVRHEDDVTHIEVAVAQLIHQNKDVFQRVRRSDQYLFGTIRAPRKCGIKRGKGQFLFTGRMRLGMATLRCAPFLERWSKIAAMAECHYN